MPRQIGFHVYSIKVREKYSKNYEALSLECPKNKNKPKRVSSILCLEESLGDYRSLTPITSE